MYPIAITIFPEGGLAAESRFIWSVFMTKQCALSTESSHLIHMLLVCPKLDIHI